MIIVHRRAPRPVRALATGSAVVMAVALGLSACGRSSNTPTGTGTSSAPASNTSTSAAPSAAPGDFGSLKAVCGSGNASGATARGVTATDIHIGVTADPGAAAAPGLEQEFFDTADGFSKWCNAAGGINGRKIVVDKLRRQALQRRPGDDRRPARRTSCWSATATRSTAPASGIREKCGLGQIPAYVVSPQAVDAKLQVQSTPIPSNEINDGAMRLLAEAYPATKTGGVGIAGSTLASLIPDRPEGPGVPAGRGHQGGRYCSSSRCRSTTTGPTSSSCKQKGARPVSTR